MTYYYVHIDNSIMYQTFSCASLAGFSALIGTYSHPEYLIMEYTKLSGTLHGTNLLDRRCEYTNSRARSRYYSQLSGL